MEKFKTYPFDKNVLVGSHGTIKTYYKYRTPLTMYDSAVILKKARVLLHNLYVKDKYYVVRCKNIKNDIKNPEEKVHRLVAITWCKGYKHGLEVNHIDGNKLNNHYKNLEWVTHAENITKYYKLKKQKEITMEQELNELELFEKDMEKLVERMKVTSKKMRKIFKKVEEVENKKVVKTKK